jgi:hypothetical protein
MHPWLRFLMLALAVAALLLPACSDDDENARDTSNPYAPGSGAGLNDAWQAGDAARGALATTDQLWADFAALAADPASDPDAVLQAATAYAAACTVAAGRLEAWQALEQTIVPAGGGKAQITETARQTIQEVLTSATAAVRQGAEGVVVAWRVLGGLASLRDALADPDGTVPVTGRLAERLAARMTARDAAVTDAILADEDHDGRLPLDDLEGGTPAARAAWYAELDAAHPLKRQCRAAVAAWDPTEHAQTQVLLEDAARGQLRRFADVGAGGASLDGLPGHLTGAEETAPPRHEMTLALQDGASGEPVDDPALILLRRRGQPAGQPRLALLTGASAQMLLELPSGRYDVLALADGWSRAVACDRGASAGGVLTLTLGHLQRASLILEDVVLPPGAGAGARVTARAVAASAAGSDLSFRWAVRGPCEEVVPLGPECVFVPDSAGVYTAVVTVSDPTGAAATDSATVTVTPFAVEVFRTDFLAEQIADRHLNPGEQDTLWLWVANRGRQEVRGVAELHGRGGLVTTAEPETWTLPAGQQTRWQVPVAVPADYDRPRAQLDFSFTADGHTLVQELDFRVDFYVELQRIASPQTSRVVTVAGTVANPTLETAELVLDRDRNQVYTLPLENGAFEQVIILPGSEDTSRRRLTVTAHSGSRQATARAGFLAAIPRADFRATLFWDTDGTDVDLWVTDPDGEKCYYANQTTATGLDLDVDDVTGYGPENITGESDLPPGDYLVQVHYYSDHGTGLDTEATVLLTLHEGTDQEQVTTQSATIGDGDVWTVATVTWNGAEVVQVAPAPRAPVTVVPRGLPPK